MLRRTRMAAMRKLHCSARRLDQSPQWADRTYPTQRREAAIRRVMHGGLLSGPFTRSHLSKD